MTDGKRPMVSLIIPAKNEGNHVKNTVESAFRCHTGFVVEIIVVDDGSNDGCCDFIQLENLGSRIKLVRTNGLGAAQARNLGAEKSVGDYLVFCDAHLFFEDLWLERLLAPIQSGVANGTAPGIASVDVPGVVRYGQTLDQNLNVQWNGPQPNPFPTPVLPGGCIAVSRDVFFDIGGFDRGFRVWGYEDIEFSFKMWLFGYQCYVVPDVKILHVFRSRHPYPVTYGHVYHNLMRMAYSHFNDERIEKCRRLIKYGSAKYIEAQVLQQDVLMQRQAYFAKRTYDDNWFMNQFGIPF